MHPNSKWMLFCWAVNIEKIYFAISSTYRKKKLVVWAHHADERFGKYAWKLEELEDRAIQRSISNDNNSLIFLNAIFWSVFRMVVVCWEISLGKFPSTCAENGSEKQTWFRFQAHTFFSRVKKNVNKRNQSTNPQKMFEKQNTNCMQPNGAHFLETLIASRWMKKSPF